MNIYIKSLLFVAISIFVASCNKIEPPFTEGKKASGLDTVVFANEQTNIQRILLEDFTGHTCGNCPAAATIAKDLYEAHPEQVIVIAMHVSDQFASPIADTGEFSYDFRTAEGTQIDQTFGASNAGLPRGMINRVTFNGTKILDRNDWASALEPLLSNSPIIDLQVKSYTLAGSDSISAYIQTKFIVGLSGEYKLCAFVIEDSIINWQKDYSKPPGQKEIENYVHMHAMRGAFVGAFGESIGTSFTVGQIVKKGYSLKMGEDWEIKNLKVVAYVYKVDSQEIVQTTETDLVVK